MSVSARMSASRLRTCACGAVGESRPQGAQRAERQARHQAEHGGVAGKEQGGGQTGGDQSGDVLTELHGAAEVPLERAAEPVRVLGGQGFVEPVLGADLRQDLGIDGPAAQQEGGRVAGGDVHEAEDEDRGRQQGQGESGQPAQYEPGGVHRLVPICAAQGQYR